MRCREIGTWWGKILWSKYIEYICWYKEKEKPAKVLQRNVRLVRWVNTVDWGIGVSCMMCCSQSTSSSRHFSRELSTFSRSLGLVCFFLAITRERNSLKASIHWATGIHLFLLISHSETELPDSYFLSNPNICQTHFYNIIKIPEKLKLNVHMPLFKEMQEWNCELSVFFVLICNHVVT